MKKKIIFTLILAVVAAGLLFWAGSKVKQALDNGGLVNLSLTTQQDIDQTPIEINSIRRIGQWEFLSIKTEELVDSVKKGFFFDDRIVCIYRGNLSLGIDMEKCDSTWISAQKGDSIALRLPAVGLLDQNFINEAETNVFFEEGNWNEKEKEELYQKARRKMLQRAYSKENRLTAEQQARIQITQLMNSMGFSHVSISFEGNTSGKKK